MLNNVLLNLSMNLPLGSFQKFSSKYPSAADKQ